MSNKATPGPAPVIWVFGGGITGLSVAHECVERGYDVYLVEPTEDSWESHLPAVGGVARTQWAYIPSDEGGADPDSVARALPFVRHPTFEFSEEEIAELAAALQKGKSSPVWQEVQGSIARFATRLIAATRGAGYQSLTVALTAPSPRLVEPGSRRPRKAPPVSRAKKAAAVVAPAVVEAPKSTEPTIEPSEEAIANAERVRAAIAQELHARLDFAREETDILRVEGMAGFRFEVRVKGRGVVPGEHGFRYFPGFYRHLFDTMRRTPVLQRGDDRFGAAVRTVFDNLVSTEATWLVVTKDRTNDAGEVEKYERLVNFPRRPPQSVQQTLTLLESFVRELGYSAQDVSRLTTKLFQYMTSSTERREGEFEDLTWWDFIEGERFSEVCRKHMELGPEVLGAMTASESEARTQGNCVTQLLIDQLSGRRLTDATLNGPTSVAWFDPWRDYLVYRGVKFIRGELVDFTPPSPDHAVHRPGVLLPKVLVDGKAMSAANFDTGLRDHYFVVAAPLTSMLDVPEFNFTARELDWRMHGEVDVPKDRFEPAAANCGYGLARKFREALDLVPAVDGQPELKLAPDIDALNDWKKRLDPPETERDVGLGPLRHLTGVQYLFDTNIQFGQEHTLYMDAPWRLSSISQAHFWRRRPTGIHGYRGIVSVDIGSLHRPAEVVEGAAPQSAWTCSPDQIANTVWAQVRPSVAMDTQHSRRSTRETPLDGVPGTSGATPKTKTPRGGRVSNDVSQQPLSPEIGIDVEENGELTPSCYHLDENLVFHREQVASPEGGRARRAPVRVAKNLTPYLINRPGEWKRRPGRLNPAPSRHDGYELQNGAWLLAGTYMKTFTRLTTMEAANESARHAVNAILRAARAPGDRCMVWDPEEWELPDFAALREIDRRLYRDGYPHMVEILGLDSIPEALLPQQLDV